MTDSAKCCCTLAFCALTCGCSASAEDHGGGTAGGGAPVVRPLASDADMVKTTVRDFAKALAAGTVTTTSEKEKAAFAVMRAECGSCHGPGKQFSSPAVFRVGKDGRPLDANRVTYFRVMLAAVQNAGKIMPPDGKLDVEEKRTLVAWLATEGVFPFRYRNPQDIPRPGNIGPTRERTLFTRDRVISGGRGVRLVQRNRGRPTFRRAPRLRLRVAG